MTSSWTFSRLAPPQLPLLPYSSASIPTRGPALCMPLEVLASLHGSLQNWTPPLGRCDQAHLVLPTPLVIASGQKLGFTHHQQDAYNFDPPNISVGKMCLTQSCGRGSPSARRLEWSGKHKGEGEVSASPGAPPLPPHSTSAHPFHKALTPSEPKCPHSRGIETQHFESDRLKLESRL